MHSSLKEAALTRWDALKILALLLMFIDHGGHFFYPDEQWLRGIGRACAPIFFFLAGFVPHFKFSIRLLILALLLTASDWLVKGAPNTLNILWGIIFIRALFAWLEGYEKFHLRLHEWMIGGLFLLPSIVLFQYGSFGILYALGGYAYKHRTHYKSTTPLYYLILLTIIYGIVISGLSQFTPETFGIMAASLTLMVLSMRWFATEPLALVSLPARPLCRFCARKTAEIYVLHLIFLGWWTHISL